MAAALLLALATLAADPIAVATPKRDKPVSYGAEVADVLETKCAGCHNEVSPRSRFRLDTVSGMLKGGRRGPALVPGNADGSLMFQMSAHRVDPAMPPADKSENKALTPEELGLLKLWIDAGAKDDSAEVAAANKAVDLGSISGAFRPIVALDLTADGRRVAFGSGDMVRVCDADTGLEITSLGGHKDFIQSLRFSPDGKRLAAGSYQIATAWDVPQGAEVKTFRGHDKAVRALVVTADGETLVSAGMDGTIRTWSVTHGNEMRKIALPSPALCLARVADGTILAAGCVDGLIRLVRLKDGQEIGVLKGHAGAIESLAAYPDGKRLLSGSADATARIWTLPAAEGQAAPEPIVLKNHAGPVLAVAVSPGGRWVYTGGEDAKIIAWDVTPDGTVAGLIFHAGGPVRALAIDPAGKRAVVGSGDGIATLIDLTAAVNPLALAGLGSAVQSVAFSPKGDRIATATAGGGVKVWEVGGKGVIAFGHLGDKAGDPPAPIHQVAFAKDGSLVTASGSNTLKMFAFEGQWSEPRTFGPHASRVLALDFSPDGSLLATGGGEPSRSGEVKVWDVKAGTLVRTLPETLHSDTVFGLRFSPDGKRLATASGDKFLKVVEVADGKEVHSFEGHTGHVLAVDWSEDGKKLATAGADNAVKIWDVEAGEQLRTLMGPTKQVTALQWTKGAGAQAVAGASGDGSVRFWEPNNGNVSRTFRGPSDYVFGVAVSRDRGRIVAGGADGVLFVWDGGGKVERKIGPKPD